MKKLILFILIILNTGVIFSDILPEWELREIKDAVQRNVPEKDLHRDLTILLIAIRKPENGSKGKEFGILNEKANTYSKQAGWCACTVYKNWIRYQQGQFNIPFLVWFGNRYCPVNADNDPIGLNENWIKNVTYYIERQYNEKNNNSN